jgi:hypothetical protein
VERGLLALDGRGIKVRVKFSTEYYPSLSVSPARGEKFSLFSF